VNSVPAFTTNVDRKNAVSHSTIPSLSTPQNQSIKSDPRRSGAGREQGLVERLALPDQHEAVTAPC
jgi:hypothetical protein